MSIKTKYDVKIKCGFNVRMSKSIRKNFVKGDSLLHFEIF